MRKNLFSVVFLALTFALVSCGGSSENKGAENVDSKDEANKIISYTNDVIDYLNGSGDWMRTNEDRISKMVSFMETKRKPSVILSIMSDVSFSMRAGKKDVITPPSVMSQEEQTFFKESMTTYKNKYEKMKENCSTLYKYIQNQDYKDDDYANGKVLADSIKAQYDYLVNIKGTLYDRIDVITEKAENIILQDLPLRDPILALKSELNNFTALNEIYSEYNDGKATADQVDAKYKEVAANVEKNKDAHTQVLEDNKAKSKYDSFYRECDDALATYRKVLREVKAGKKVTDRNFKDFSSDYNSLIKAYNRFVN